MRRLVAAVAVVLSATLVAGCANGPSQIGSAAIVGDTAIPVEYVQSWWDEFAADPQIKAQLDQNGEFDDLGRTIAITAVRHELTAQVAVAENLRFDEAQVSEYIEQLGGEEAAVQATNSIYDASRIRERMRDELVLAALARKHMDSTAVRFGYTTVQSRADAEAKAEQVAAAGVDGAADIFEADAAAGLDADPDRTQSVGTDPAMAVESAFFRAPAGTVVAWAERGAASAGQWKVALIREHSTDASGDGVSAAELNDAQLYQVGLSLLAWHARDIQVRLNPRYGVWDPTYLIASPTEGESVAFSRPIAQSSGA